MAKKKLRQCRRARDFETYARRRGARIRNGGRHGVNVVYRGYSVPLPTHPGEIRPGTRRAIIRTFVRIGLVVFPILAAWAAMGGLQ